MADSNSQTAIAFLGAPIGGGAIAFGIWMLLKEPCTSGPLTMDCVVVAGETVYGPAGLVTLGGGLGFIAACLIALTTRSGD